MEATRPSPGLRHQQAVVRLVLELGPWARGHGGEVLPGLFHVYVHERELTEPLAAPPDLLVEVSSPSTRARDLGVKRDIYERFGVPEYWFVDLERNEVLVFRLGEDGYGEPDVHGPADTLHPDACPGLAVPWTASLWIDRASRRSLVIGSAHDPGRCDMEATRPAGVTWTDLLSWPEDGNRYELLDGELVVSPSPGLRHQEAVMALALALGGWAQQHGGVALTGPFDVYVHEREFTEPDVLYVRPERVSLFEERRLAAPPDLLVEVSSPSTRARDLGVKRNVYERFGVPEYWFVDLERNEVLVFRLGEDGYGEPDVHGPGDTLHPDACPGLAVIVDRVLP